MDVFTQEDEAAWRAFLGDLTARGLAGVQLVVSDDHRGLTNAIDALPPGASWQRCRTHCMRNLLTRVPKKRGSRSWPPWCAASSLKPSAEEVAAQLARVTEQLRARFSQVAEMLADVSPGRDRLRRLAGRALALDLVQRS